jgi:hypothetical protein
MIRSIVRSALPKAQAALPNATLLDPWMMPRELRCSSPMGNGGDFSVIICTATPSPQLVGHGVCDRNYEQWWSQKLSIGAGRKVSTIK